MTRRELLALASSATLLKAQTAKASPVAISRCASYTEDLPATLGPMFDRIGGLNRLVGNKTVVIKLNLTGSPGLRFQGKPLGVTHYSHPRTIEAMVHLMGRAGAKRIRLVESAWGTAGPLEEYMLDSGWNVRALQNAAPKVEFENTNAIGTGKRYASVKVPSGGYIFPAYQLNQSYIDTDVFVSMAKLKNHATCGITLAMKNCFGNTPASIYGDDAGLDEPNESPTKGRLDVCHFGKRQPSKVAPSELDVTTSREPEFRMPRITAELNSARPVDIAFIDGIETVTGGEGPWIRNLKHVKPGILILGTNAVCTDAVGTAVMGYDPRAQRGTAPFAKCDNMLLLAEALGAGSADLKQIDVRGISVAEARFPFPA
ncbi:MAG: DUF362 domain-containing protein [Bryobacteraceae bacterium]|nr:DUF362 domain-containing protein [Bryobacteraceae bacterium]